MKTEEDATMNTSNEEMVVRIRFDREVDLQEADLFTTIVAGVLEFRGLICGRYSTSGWGIGSAKVIKVEQLLPGDLAGVESAEMLALRLEGAGRADLAAKAREGLSRSELLGRVFVRVESDWEAARIIAGEERSP